MSATDEPRRLSALLLVACLLALGGCGGSDDDADTQQPGTTTSTTAHDAQPKQPLPAAWYDDPDGDLVPTAVEQEMGTDSAVDECAQEAGCGEAGPVNALERSNTLLILDSSGSMAGSAGGGVSKLNAAKRALRRYVAGTPDSLALGFMVYGHKGTNAPAGKARSCAGVELLDPLGTTASKRFDRTLSRFKPAGYTPLAGALREARGVFAGEDDAINRIILVTDGIETCGGDPVREARRLKRAGIRVTTDVVGFDVAKTAEARRLRAIAEASGGTYSDARTAAALDDFFEAERERYDELAKEYLCVVDKAGEVSLCQRETLGKAVLYMHRARSAAAQAGDEEAADEINRLRKELEAAGDTRDRAFEGQSKATAERLQREVEEAQRRLDRLAP